MAQVKPLPASVLPTYLRERSFLANAAGHFTVDVLNSNVSLILAFLTIPLGLTNTRIGLIATAYTFANSLTQPIFGWLADRYGTRWIGPGGVVWMSLFFTCSALSSGWQAILFLIIAALGSAAYHPQGAMRAGQVEASRVVMATAVFFLFGQAGSGVGPTLAGRLLEEWGRPGLLALAGLNLLVGLWLWRASHPAHAPGERPASASPAATRLGAVALALFALLLFTRMTVQATTSTFLPKHMSDLGWSPAAYGLALSMVMMGSALGNIVGGGLADRVGRRRLVSGSLLLAAPALAFYLNTSETLLYALLFLIGLCMGAGNSVNVVMAQAMLPGRKALASGLAMGFMFASGAVGAAIAGAFADRVGLAGTLQSMAVVSIVGGLCALALPPSR